MIPDIGALHFQSNQDQYRVAYHPDFLWHLVDQQGNRSNCYIGNEEIARLVCDERNEK